MGFRFRRTIKVLPGIRLNLSRSGVSTSVGVRGAHITAGHGKVRETVGIPGSGIYYTESQSTHQAHGDGAEAAQAPADAARPSLLGRIVRVLVLGVLGAFALSVALLWALATFLH